MKYAESISARPDGRGGIIISMMNDPDSKEGDIEEVRLTSRRAAMFAGEIIKTLQQSGESYMSASQVALELGITRQAIDSRHRSGSMPTPDVEIRSMKGARGEVSMRYWTRRALERSGILHDGERGSGDAGLIGGIFWLLVLFYLFF